MEILLMLIGALAIALGVVRLLRTFGGGLRDRDVARTDTVENLVQPALLITFGLFLSFFGLANLLGVRYAGA
jgi:hypothetical protein